MDTQPTARIATPGFISVCAASLAALTSFFLLLSTVPLYAARIAEGGEADVVAGLATGALMLTTVLAELITPRLMEVVGPRKMFAVALVCLGTPALALAATDSLAAVLVACLVRGLGFGVTVVVGGALVAELAAPGRRGETLGVYGVVVTVPAVGALPLGVWTAESIGFEATFVIGGIAAFLGLFAMVGLRARRSVAGGADDTGIMAALRDGALVRPALVFSMTALAAGTVVTFLPLANGVSPRVAALGLFVQALTATGARWWAGRVGDRHGAATLILPGLVAATLGTAGLLLRAEPVVVLLAMTVFGFGFGVTQNASMTVMFERAEPARYGAVSGLWNLGYDVGLGVGAVGFGFVVAGTGYSPAFAVVAVLMCAMLPLAVLERRRR